MIYSTTTALLALILLSTNTFALDDTIAPIARFNFTEGDLNNTVGNTSKKMILGSAVKFTDDKDGNKLSAILFNKSSRDSWAVAPFEKELSHLSIFTITLWIKFEGDYSKHNLSTIFSCGSEADQADNFLNAFYADVETHLHDAGTDDFVASAHWSWNVKSVPVKDAWSEGLKLNTWTFIVISRSEDGTLSLYQGINKHDILLLGEYQTDRNTPMPSLTGVVFGAFYSGHNYKPYQYYYNNRFSFGGAMDEITIYDHLVNETELQGVFDPNYEPPTPFPTAEPTPGPTAQPTAEPTAQPTETPEPTAPPKTVTLPLPPTNPPSRGVTEQLMGSFLSFTVPVVAVLCLCWMVYMYFRCRRCCRNRRADNDSVRTGMNLPLNDQAYLAAVLEGHAGMGKQAEDPADLIEMMARVQTNAV